MATPAVEPVDVGGTSGCAVIEAPRRPGHGPTAPSAETDCHWNRGLST